MIYDQRRFQITVVQSIEQLAEKVTVHDWTACTGFRLGEWLFLNDSSGPDGAQEYAVVRDGWQYESVTFSWMPAEKIVQWWHGFIADPRPFCKVDVKPHPEGACSHCA